jgi:hypothetical protein
MKLFLTILMLKKIGADTAHTFSHYVETNPWLHGRPLLVTDYQAIIKYI